MKKCIAILLSLMMLICCFGAIAETAETTEAPAAQETSPIPENIVPGFKIYTVLPEGYTASEEIWMDPYFVITSFTNPDVAKPNLMLLIAYNDSMANVTLNDESLQDPEILNFVQDAAYDDEAGQPIPYELEKTGLGTSIVIFEFAGQTEFFTVWHGYEISLTAAVADAEGVPRPVSEEEKTLIMQFLTDMDISKLVVEE